MTMHLLSI